MYISHLCYLYPLPLDFITLTILDPGAWADHAVSYLTVNSSGRGSPSLLSGPRFSHVKLTALPRRQRTILRIVDNGLFYHKQGHEKIRRNSEHWSVGGTLGRIPITYRFAKQEPVQFYLLQTDDSILKEFIYLSGRLTPSPLR